MYTDCPLPKGRQIHIYIYQQETRAGDVGYCGKWFIVHNELFTMNYCRHSPCDSTPVKAALIQLSVPFSSTLAVNLVKTPSAVQVHSRSTLAFVCNPGLGIMFHVTMSFNAFFRSLLFAGLLPALRNVENLFDIRGTCNLTLRVFSSLIISSFLVLDSGTALFH